MVGIKPHELDRLLVEHGTGWDVIVAGRMGFRRPFVRELAWFVRGMPNHLDGVKARWGRAYVTMPEIARQIPCRVHEVGRLYPHQLEPDVIVAGTRGFRVGRANEVVQLVRGRTPLGRHDPGVFFAERGKEWKWIDPFTNPDEAVFDGPVARQRLRARSRLARASDLTPHGEWSHGST